MDNELNNLNGDNKSENNTDLLENNNQENQINYKSNKWKKILIEIIVLIVIFIIALTIYVFVINKNVNKDNIGQGNNSNVEDNNQNINYKMEKILDYTTTELLGSLRIEETEKYYILDHYNETILYDKKGKDVTKQVFGTSDISINKGDIFIINTNDGRYGLYDKNFNEIVKLSNQVIERTDFENYFFVGDSGNSAFLENVGIYDKSGKLLVPREYERLNLIRNAEKLLFYAKRNGKCGIIDVENNVIVPFEYDDVSERILFYLGVDYNIKTINSNENKYYILIKNGKYGMVDSNNNVIIDFDKDRLSYSKYANAAIEEDNENKIINVYNLNGELKKTIDLGKGLSYEVGAKHYKLDTDDYIFYDDEYIYLLNTNLEFEKYIKPYAYSSAGGDGSSKQYLVNSNIYLTSNDTIKFKVHNTKDNTLMYSEEFYLIDYYGDIETILLCKDKLGDNYSKCGIIGYDGKIVLNFNYGLVGKNLISENEKIVITEDGKNGKWYIKKIGINGNCRINNDIYEVKNNVVITYEGNNSVVYNSSCNLILNSETNDYSRAYSLNEDLVMTEKKQSSKPNIYKIYNSKDGKQVNIGNDDKTVITWGVIGRTLNNEPIVYTDKGIYKIVKE